MATKKNTSSSKKSTIKAVPVEKKARKKSASPAPARVKKEATSAVPKSKGGHDNGYPFLTKAQVKDKLRTDDKFVISCLGTMLALQTSNEQSNSRTMVRNRQGFMSSHAKVGTELAQRAASGKLETAELETARTLVSCYSKQLAAELRRQAAESDPELAKAGEAFGV